MSDRCGHVSTDLMGRYHSCAEPVGHTCSHREGLVYWDRSDVEDYSRMLRAMARRVGNERRLSRNAMRKSQRRFHQSKQLLNQLGSAVGVHVGSPSESRYPEFADRIVAVALRARADNAELRVENDDLRRQVADELSRLGQEMERPAEVCTCAFGSSCDVCKSAPPVGAIRIAFIQSGDQRQSRTERWDGKVWVPNGPYKAEPPGTYYGGKDGEPGIFTLEEPAPECGHSHHESWDVPKVRMGMFRRENGVAHYEPCPKPSDPALDMLRRLVELWGPERLAAEVETEWHRAFSEARRVLNVNDSKEER